MMKLLGFLKGLIPGNAVLIAAAAALAALVLWRSFEAGRVSVVHEQQRQTIDNARMRNNEENAARRFDDNQLDRMLRSPAERQ